MFYTCNRAGFNPEELVDILAFRAAQGHDLAIIDPERLCAKVGRRVRGELVGIFHLTEFNNLAGILLHGLCPGSEFGKGGRIRAHASSYPLFDPRDTVLGPRLQRNDYSTKIVVVIDNAILEDARYTWLISSANGTLPCDRVRYSPKAHSRGLKGGLGALIEEVPTTCGVRFDSEQCCQ